MMKNSLRFQVFIFTATRIVINTLYRMIYPFLRVFERGLGVSYIQITQALTWRSLIGVFGPLLASIADSRGRKTGMLTGLGMLLISLGIVVFWPTYIGLVTMLLVSALGKLTFDPSMQAYLGDRVAYERRGLVIAITELGWSGAFFFGVPLTGFVIARAGWLAPFPLIFVLILISTLLLVWMLPKDPKPDTSNATALENFGKVLTSKPSLAGLAVTFCLSIANEFVNISFGGWLEIDFGLKVAALGTAAAVIGAAEIGGESLVGALADRLGKKRGVLIGLLGNIVAGFLLPSIGRNMVWALVGLFIFYLSFEFTFVTLIPLMTEVLPVARATLMALNSASASLGRALADWSGPVLFSGDLRASAYASVLLNLVGLLFLRGIYIAGKEQ